MVEPIVIEGQRAWLKQYGKGSRALALGLLNFVRAVSISMPCARRRTVVVTPRAKPRPAALQSCRRKA